MVGDVLGDPFELLTGALVGGQGGLNAEPDDYQLLAKGRFVYDALYAWCQYQVPAPA